MTSKKIQDLYGKLLEIETNNIDASTENTKTSYQETFLI